MAESRDIGYGVMRVDNAGRWQVDCDDDTKKARSKGLRKRAKRRSEDCRRSKAVDDGDGMDGWQQRQVEVLGAGIQRGILRRGKKELMLGVSLKKEAEVEAEGKVTKEQKNARRRELRR